MFRFRKPLVVGVFFMCCAAFTMAACYGEAVPMSGDPQLAGAYESYEKGLKNEERGDREFTDRFGQAQRMYEHAEDYYLNAAFMYKQLGMEHGINVEREIDACEKAYRNVHVKTNKARKKTRKR
ncbi:MAG: hypothetical protein ABIA77_00345 [Candidatus Omnitrophota bacterium]